MLAFATLALEKRGQREFVSTTTFFFTRLNHKIGDILIRSKYSSQTYLHIHLTHITHKILHILLSISHT